MWIVHILIVNLIIVFITELTPGFFLGARKTVKIITVALVNIITNPLAVVFSLWLTISFYQFRTIGILLAEIIIVFAEGFMYKKFDTFSTKNPYSISLLLNITSYSAGEIIKIIM